MTWMHKLAVPSMVMLCSLSVGCQKGLDEKRTVKSPPEAEQPIVNSASYLPLSPGCSWTFETKVDQRTFIDVAVVRGRTTVGGLDAVLVETKRNGQLVLREAYRSSRGMVMLAAFSTSPKQWVMIDPPLPLLRDGAHLGDEYLWNGKLRTDGKSIDAHGLSRLSLREAVQTQSAGRFSGVRIDSGIAAPLPNGDHIKYQTTRWLATGIGFIRREYLDSAARRQSNLVNFKLK